MRVNGATLGKPQKAAKKKKPAKAPKPVGLKGNAHTGAVAPNPAKVAMGKLFVGLAYAKTKYPQPKETSPDPTPSGDWSNAKKYMSDKSVAAAAGKSMQAPKPKKKKAF